MKKLLAIILSLVILSMCFISCEEDTDNSSQTINTNSSNNESGETASLSAMTAEQLLTYAASKLASADNYTAIISGNVSVKYSGNTINMTESGVIKMENLNGDTPEMLTDMTLDTGDNIVMMSMIYTDGYYYTESPLSKVKVAMTKEQAVKLFNSSIFSVDDTGSDSFQGVKKTDATDGGWSVTCSGMNNVSASSAFGGLISSFGVDVSANDIEFNNITIKFGINKEGLIVTQNLQLTMSIDAMGTQIEYDMDISSEFKDYGSTTVNISVNSNNFSEVDYSNMFG
ncbi:MAG: hypothetical protein EOM87_04410 [Clostridia bacterium]|nr:hypothetical protein [Clostridia bacterium]